MNIRSFFQKNTKAKPYNKGRGKQTRVVKRLPVKHTHLGVARNFVVEIDLTKSTIAVRLAGCRSRKTYQVEDLFLWGAQATFL